VAKIGRNDPCPCGSGKKYKNCCLRKDRAKRIQEAAWRREEQITLDKLVTFAQRPGFQPQIIVAFDLFWNGHYGIEGLNALDRNEIGRFLDWYVYDYRLEQSGKRLIELFIEEVGPSLLPAERERAHTWQDSYLSIYRIAAPPEQNQLSIVDVLQDDMHTVQDSGLGRLGLPGDLILGRILRSSDPPHFSWAAILLPASIEGGLVTFARRAYEQYQEMHAQASWPDFLSHSGYIFNHYLLKFAAEGREPGYATAAYYNASQTVKKLMEVEKRLREQVIKETRALPSTQQNLPTKEGETVRRTRGGILLPGYVQYKGIQEPEQ